MLDSLESQIFKDFEFILVDGLYDQRKDQVREILKNYSFPIIYVKDKPWYHSDEEKFGVRPGLSSARNTGVMHASGDLIVWFDDNTWLPPDWLVRHVQAFRLGFDGMAGLAHGTYDATFLEEKHKELKREYDSTRCIPCQVQNKPCTHMVKIGELTLIRDYRKDYNQAEILVRDKQTGEVVYHYHRLPMGWLYGTNMSIRTEYILKINGFPEEFCGQMGSEDCFTSICLERAGARLVLDKNCYVIHISDRHHVGFNDVFNFKNREVMLRDGKLHFSNEKFVENLIFEERDRFRNNPHFDLRQMREQKLKDLRGD
jgi:glycosyltransferase involved in cell wall biosynthesis